MVKYLYAKDETEKLIDINSLNEDNRNKTKFLCICCGNELIAKLGKIKVHHFAHKKDVTCSRETYLHRLGKQLFYEHYIDCLENQKPFRIELYQSRNCTHFDNKFDIKCELDNILNHYDLTQFFKKIELESEEGQFIPDLLLTSKNGKDKIFIEIAVTHLSSEQKCDSKYKIIEFLVESENDFEPIKRNLLSINQSHVKFLNFTPKIINSSFCKGNCKVEYFLLTLDKDGKCVPKQERNLTQIEHHLKENIQLVTYSIIPIKYGYDYSLFFKSGVAKFAANNFKIKNCFICRYHANNDSWQYTYGSKSKPIFCKQLKIKCNSNQAINCDYFKLENRYIQEHLLTFQKFEKEMKRQNENINENEFYNH